MYICREDAKVTSGEPTGVQACNVPQGASYTVSSIPHPPRLLLTSLMLCLHATHG